MSTYLPRRIASVALAERMRAHGRSVLAQTTAQSERSPTPEEAVKALDRDGQGRQPRDVAGDLRPRGQGADRLVDPAIARQNQQVFTVAVREKWHLEDAAPDRKTLVIGNEDWPFPVPLVKAGNGWRFDTAAGKEEVLARRIGRNELAVIDATRAYVTAQRRYAEAGHDGKPAGLLCSEVPERPGQRERLVLADGAWAEAKSAGRSGGAGRGRRTPARAVATAAGAVSWLLLQDPDRAGIGRRKAGPRATSSRARCPAGSRSSRGRRSTMSTGIMTFIVNQDGVVREKDLGPGTDAAARKMTAYNPDSSWRVTK